MDILVLLFYNFIHKTNFPLPSTIYSTITIIYSSQFVLIIFCGFILLTTSNFGTRTKREISHWNMRGIHKLCLVQLIKHPILRIPNILFFLLSEYFFQIKVLNWYQYTPKNAKITHYIKKKKQQLCNTLNWGNWNLEFVKLGVRWAERDKSFEL